MSLKETAKKFFRLSKKDEFKYPCKECIVLATCSKLCDKVKKNTHIIFKQIKENKRCPDCGRTIILEDKSSQNIICTTCRHRFFILVYQ